jgi:hypothetical protein
LVIGPFCSRFEIRIGYGWLALLFTLAPSVRGTRARSSWLRRKRNKAECRTRRQVPLSGQLERAWLCRYFGVTLQTNKKMVVAPFVFFAAGGRQLVFWFFRAWFERGISYGWGVSPVHARIPPLALGIHVGTPTT